MVAFVGSVDGGLFAAIRDVVPAAVVVESAIVTRSLDDLAAIAAETQARLGSEPGYGVSIAPQDNTVIVRTPDGSVPSGLPDGVVGMADTIVPTSCNPSSRCTLRPFRGGEQILNKFGSSQWEQCTSGFFVRRSSGSLAMVTAAHCQRDYSVLTVYGKDHTDAIATWGPDTTPTRSITCLSVCDMDTEVQLLTGLTSYPAAKNLIFYDSSTTARAITALRNYGSSWAGALVCSAGVASDKSCGTITSIGSGAISLVKEGYTARINKGAYATNPVAGGDSGGPVVNGGTAYGTMTAGTGSGSFFSALSPALSALSATLCTTSSC